MTSVILNSSLQVLTPPGSIFLHTPFSKVLEPHTYSKNQPKVEFQAFSHFAKCEGTQRAKSKEVHDISCTYLHYVY